jgi:hypothetical protein
VVTDLAQTTFEDACNRLFELHADGFKRDPRSRRSATGKSPNVVSRSMRPRAGRTRATSWI